MGKRGNGEIQKHRNGEMRKCRNGEMGKRGNKETGKQGNGETGKWASCSSTCVDQSKHVTVLCLDHLSSKNSRLNDSFPDACISLWENQKVKWVTTIGLQWLPLSYNQVKVCTIWILETYKYRLYLLRTQNVRDTMPRCKCNFTPWSKLTCRKLLWWIFHISILVKITRIVGLYWKIATCSYTTERFFCRFLKHK